MHTRIKICGITDADAAAAVAACGADALGLVFHPASARAVTPEQARLVAAAVAPFVSVVGVFVDPEPEAVRAALAAVRLDCLQFHGGEAPDFCRAFGVPYIKSLRSLRLGAAADFAAAERRYACARGLLVDSGTEQRPGGTGGVFDWTMLPPPRARALPLVLAGGLDADNVAAAVRTVRPYAVDLSSGVETAPGVKDARKIASFIAALRAADAAAAPPSSALAPNAHRGAA